MCELHRPFDDLKYRVAPHTPVQDAVIFYHGGCHDGFFAALYVREALRLKDIQSIHVPVSYARRRQFVQDWLPHLHGKSVFIVDFSITPEDFSAIVDVATGVLMLDHHESVLSEWHTPPGDVHVFSYPVLDRPLPPETEMRPYLPVAHRGHVPITALPRIGQFFYNKKASGVGLAHRYFQHVAAELGISPTLVDCHRLVDYLQDRDLWTKLYAESDLISSYIASTDWMLREDLDGALKFLAAFEARPDFRAQVIELARAFAEAHEHSCRVVIRDTLTYETLPTVEGEVPVVVCNYRQNSRVGEMLYNEGYPMAMMVNVSALGERVSLSFRSGPGGIHVGNLAKYLGEIGYIYKGYKAYGGGGHAGAAGLNLMPLASVEAGAVES